MGLPTRRWILALGVLALACGGKPTGEAKGEPATSPSPSPSPSPADPGAPSPTPAAGAMASGGDSAAAASVGAPAEPAAEPGATPPAAEGLEIVRAEAAAKVSAKAEPALYFERKGVRELHALAGAPAQPSWAAPLDGDLAALRDDDLLSGVSCTSGQDKPCAFGLAFAEPVPLRALRISTAFGPRWRDFNGRPRVKTLRIHTDAGAIEVEIKDGQTARYVLLGDAVTTRTVALEAVDAHGKADAPYFFAEIEAYGASGPARGPITIDPAALYYRFDSERWKDRGAHFEIRPSHVERSGPEGAPQRLATATAVYGQAGDRLLLFETVREATCQSREGGSYVVLDTQTRLWLDLGQLGALGGTVWRHAGGLGFVVGAWDDANHWPQGVLLGDDGLKRIRVGKKGLTDGSPEAQLGEWGMDPTPARSGVAGEVGAPPAGCTSASEAQVERLGAELSGLDGGASRWITCALAGEGGGEVMLYAPPRCPGPWALVVVDGAGAVKVSTRGTESGRSPRIWPGSAGGWRIELDRSTGDQGDLVEVSASGEVVEVASAAGGPLRPPGACGCEAK